MNDKIFKNLDEQIEILKSRGLVIKNVQSAKDILFRENYFFISGYRHLFTRTSKDKFLYGTTFEELYGAFTFDRKIRNILFKNILIVENNIKSIISYQMSRKYGIREKEYLSPNNYTQDEIKIRQVRDILEKMKRQIRINGKEHTATMHYISNYGYIPMWILVKVLSLGIVSEFYNILKPEDQIKIADFYNLDPETLSIYLAMLANFRNVCAHEDILYDHRIQRPIPDCKYHYLLDIEKDTEDVYRYGKNDMYAVVIILKQMLTPEEFREFIYEMGYEIDVLDGKVDTVPLESILSKIGFPNNWREILELK